MNNESTPFPRIDFRLKPTTSLKKLMRAYSKKSGFTCHELQFKFKGEAIREDHTPQALEMKQDDIITVKRNTEDIAVTMKQLNIH